ncbi:hypothetical protein GGI07_001740 [Coemansia sp. Benny D115]|nr:hypothetical protein GGI07_001740 [Coemansia sp. Benny D115]
MVDDTVAYTFKALPHVFQEIKKSSCHLFAQSQIDGLSSTAITGLALFEFDGDIEEDNILEFIHRNSPTLEELKINEIANGVVSDLAFTCAGEPAVFPRLRRLHLKRSVDSRPHFDEVETVTTVVFPELKWVTLEMEYPFNDDTLFRGNVATMQYLDMQVDKRSIDILTKHNVFTPERGRTLQSLCLKVPESAQTMSAKTLARVSEFATESLSSPRRLCIDSIDISKHVLRVSALKNTCMYGLRELSIPCTKLSLSELASLLGALPYLLELGYECTELEDDLASVPPGELPSCVQRKYSPLSRHLKTVNYSTADTEKTAAVATYAMLMAIICPRLTLVTVANSIYKSYRDYIDHAKAQAPFDAYAAQIAVLEKKKALVIEMPRF